MKNFVKTNFNHSYCYWHFLLSLRPDRVGLLFASWLFNLRASFDTSKISIFPIDSAIVTVDELRVERSENLTSEDYAETNNRTESRPYDFENWNVQVRNLAEHEGPREMRISLLKSASVVTPGRFEL